MFLFPKAVVDENFKSIARRERHLPSSCQFVLFRNYYVCARVSIVHMQTCQILLHATEVPWRGPRRPSACQTLVGQGRRALPEHCRAGQSFGTLPFFAQKIRGGARSAFGCPNSGSARQASAARTMPGKANFWDFAVFLGKTLPWWRGRWGGHACLRLPEL
jgi:hypothetical protein